MKTTELTDIDGDALTITQRLDATWITCTKGAEEVTIGPVPTDAVRNAFQEPMGGDDMDGGVTAAAIEAEVVSPERARSLVQELEKAHDLMRSWRTAAEALGVELEALNAHPRPLTADDITDEMVERAWDRWIDLDPRDIHSMRLALRAALAPPPSRPEGAEELDELVDRSIRGCSDITSPETVRAIANGLAEEGVLAPGAES